MQVAVILPAAGLGRRFAETAGVAPAEPAPIPSKSKIELELAGKPVFLRAVELFLNRPAVRQIVLAVNPDALDDFRFRWADKLAFQGVTIVPGGRQERWETVLKALGAVEPSCTHAAIHDAARPMTSGRLIDRVYEAAEKFPAVIPGVPVSATLKRTARDEAAERRTADPLDAILGGSGRSLPALRRVVQTIDRADVVEVQTPQVFEVGLLRRAYQQVTGGKLRGAGITDDAGLVEALGEPVYVVDGEATNLKITRPDDLKLAEAYLHMTERKEAVVQAKKRLFKDEED